MLKEYPDILTAEEAGEALWIGGNALLYCVAGQW